MVSSTRRTAGCGPACPVVWQGRVGDHFPYADRVGPEGRYNRNNKFKGKGLRSSRCKNRNGRDLSYAESMGLRPALVECPRWRAALVARHLDVIERAENFCDHGKFVALG